MSSRAFTFAFAALVSGTAARQTAATENVAARGVDVALSSPFFRNNSRLPGYFTCDGPNIAPALRWRLPPNGKSAALVLEDVTRAADEEVTGAADDRPVHWVAWDIAGESLDLNQAPRHEGMSDFKGTAGYRGPCPSDRSAEHTYRFTVVAVDVASLSEGTSKKALPQGTSTWADVEGALRGHEVGRSSLVFTYRRGEPQLTLPPRLPSDGKAPKGNPRLSKKYSPDLLYDFAAIRAILYCRLYSYTTTAARPRRFDALPRRLVRLRSHLWQARG
jgi:phosphatidylethanolamine-binding protein (PEBP) family uncharacterized protein